MQNLYEQFKKEKEYLEGVSPRTIKYYGWVFSSYERLSSGGDQNTGCPTKQALKAWVIALTESGISSATINSYIRGYNSFLTWLKENGYMSELLRIPKVRESERVPKTFTEEHLKRFLSFHPKTFAERRLYAFGVLCL